MELNVRESAILLNVSEKTIYRWIRQGGLPAYRVHEQYRLNRAELLEWATARGVNVSIAIFTEPQPTPAAVSLADAISAGGIHYAVPATDKVAALRAVVERTPLPQDAEREFVLQVLLARESLGSTAIGNGIALPHVRNPVVVHVPCPTATLCFLERPVEYGSLDGQPVHTLFTLLSPTVRDHLQMLARLSFALRQPAFAAVIAGRAAPERILQACADVDRSIPASRPGNEG
jgi:PTS system nitrogen regulatory IIA component